MDKTQVHYCAEIDYRRPGQICCSGTYSPATTATDARVKLAEHLAYYTSLDGQYAVQITRARIVASCSNCNGAGQVRRGVRVIKMVRCPVCRGKSEETIETWVNLPKLVWV